MQKLSAEDLKKVSGGSTNAEMNAILEKMLIKYNVDDVYGLYAANMSEEDINLLKKCMLS